MVIFHAVRQLAAANQNIDVDRNTNRAPQYQNVYRFSSPYDDNSMIPLPMNVPILKIRTVLVQYLKRTAKHTLNTTTCIYLLVETPNRSALVTHRG